MSDPTNSLLSPEENNKQQPQTKGEEPQNESPETGQKNRSHIKRFSSQVEPAKEQEDALAQTRQALIEEDLKKQSRFLEKAKRRLKKKPAAAEPRAEETKAEEPVTANNVETPPGEEIPVERLLAEETKEAGPKPEPPSDDAAADEADLVGLLDMLSGVQESSEIVPDTVEPAKVTAEAKALPPAREEDVKEAQPAPHPSSKELIKTPAPHEKPLEVTSLREVALQDYAEPPKEKVYVHRKNFWDQLDEKLSGERFTTIVRFASLGILAIAAAIVVIIFLILRDRSAAAQPPQVTASPTLAPQTPLPPYPIQVQLPGGWMFALGKGNIVDYKWNPKGAEWLVGTEICKWIALPWSSQLEAVFKTLKPGDPIILVMSNFDRWLYKVQSYQSVEVNKMSGLDRNSPSVLLILVKPGSNTRQVITAIP